MANLRVNSACVRSCLAHGHHVPQASANSWKPRYQMIAEARIRKERGNFNTWKLVHLWLDWMRHKSLHRRCRVTQCCCDCSAPPLNISTANVSESRKGSAVPVVLQHQVPTSETLQKTEVSTVPAVTVEVRPGSLVDTCLITRQHRRCWASWCLASLQKRVLL